MRYLFAAILTAIGILAQGSASVACGTETKCSVGARHYYIAMPERHKNTAPVGAIVFAHGYRGSATGIMRNSGFRRMASDMGIALIAIKSLRDDWALPNAPSENKADGSKELAYVDAVLTDVTKRFAIDPGRIVASGFSAGGMMTWTLACHRSAVFAGFIPISGTFWAPVPESCTGPVANIIHIHGDSDRIVPLSGRPIGKAHQGDVAKALEIYGKHGDFTAGTPMKRDDLTCVVRTNAEENILNFCLFEGGHAFRSAFLRSAWAMLAEAGKL